MKRLHSSPRSNAPALSKELRECISRYYNEFDNPTGGSMHIVLDDFHYGDDSVRYCIEFAETGFIKGSADGVRPPTQVDPDPLGAAIGRKLLALSLEERAAANDARTCVCGHAMSLHSWEDPDGYGGISSAGACASSTCVCVDAKQVEDV